MQAAAKDEKEHAVLLFSVERALSEASGLVMMTASLLWSEPVQFVTLVRLSLAAVTGSALLLQYSVHQPREPAKSA